MCQNKANAFVRGCERKEVHFTRESAMVSAGRLLRDTGEIVYPYRCSFCGFIHNGHAPHDDTVTSKVGEYDLISPRKQKKKEKRDKPAIFAAIAATQKAKERHDQEIALHEKVLRYEKHITGGYFSNNPATEQGQALLKNELITPDDKALVQGLLDNLDFYRKQKGWEKLHKTYSVLPLTK